VVNPVELDQGSERPGSPRIQPDCALCIACASIKSQNLKQEALEWHLMQKIIKL
jgi:hypothetical protein